MHLPAAWKSGRFGRGFGSEGRDMASPRGVARVGDAASRSISDAGDGAQVGNRDGTHWHNSPIVQKQRLTLQFAKLGLRLGARTGMAESLREVVANRGFALLLGFAPAL